MKTAELTGALLDYWVARAEGYDLRPLPGGGGWSGLATGNSPKPLGYAIKILVPMPSYEVMVAEDICSPSTNWTQGGPLIEREGITPYQDPWWCEGCFGTGRYLAGVKIRAVNGRDYGGETGQDEADIEGEHIQAGPTYLIAAMRCYVASRFGPEVPDED